MKHAEVPNQIDSLKDLHKLEHGDKIIYAAIRVYMNSETRECYPAIRTIAQTLKCSTVKVQNALKRLLATGLIRKSTKGDKNHYYFPETDFDKHFEMFTEEFLKMDIPLNIKEYYMDIQPFLYGKENGVGKCSFSNAELARRTGWTVISIKKYNTWLIKHGLLAEEESAKTDEAGLPVIIKSFDLQGLNQAALWVKAVTKQIAENTEDINKMKEELAELKAWKAQIEKERALKRNETPIETEFKF